MSASGNLRDLPRHRPHRDPSGKAALFSSATPANSAAPALAASGSTRVDDRPGVTPDNGPHRHAETERRPGTVVVECGDCRARSRTTLVDLALLNLPVSCWLPLPGLHFNRYMTCPACRQRAWVRVHWLA